MAELPDIITSMSLPELDRLIDLRASFYYDVYKDRTVALQYVAYFDGYYNRPPRRALEEEIVYVDEAHQNAVESYRDSYADGVHFREESDTIITEPVDWNRFRVTTFDDQGGKTERLWGAENALSFYTIEITMGMLYPRGKVRELPGCLLAVVSIFQHKH
ncbi:hypothetical protein J4460_07680 [Candidatus Woesearchaeota archaeon]|nr:MAG: hypothetical protein QS99_C0011G0016 [archaeon GW2011_AR4]MBS3130518.1 hypothetical protein [Candidatus Woesearchaeota archaeon]HIH37998.1 hypothetical protein [Candidatus Woesearchaeota archaeon]HIH48667.1 hypothetical protein [Candidatus Woesearchaeota archaeon]HIJ02967.1 hypothetical protein [Candidatus Woesearchaeota archaeon]